MTNIEFIQSALCVHGDKYDYSLVEYNNSKSKVYIICEEHGKFLQLPNNHLMGHGCKKCRSLRKNTIDLIIDFEKTHGDKYDYSLVEYKGANVKVEIICKKHGVFTQLPYSHISGRGCIKCDKSHELSNDEYIERSIAIYGDRYDYSLLNYTKSYKEVTIICKEHGSFQRVATDHLSGWGCRLCSENCQLSKNEIVLYFNEKHQNKYIYNIDNYVNLNSIIGVFCETHGWFYMKAEYHKYGMGCRVCSNLCKSKGEKSIETLLLYNNIEYETEKTFDGCVYKNKLRFDFYLPSYNICIEYDGIQHFEPRFGGDYDSLCELQKRDVIKDKYCLENYIYLIRIPYYEYDNIESIIKEKIISMKCE